LDQQISFKLVGRSSNGQVSSRGVSRTANCTHLYVGHLRETRWKGVARHVGKSIWRRRV